MKILRGNPILPSWIHSKRAFYACMGILSDDFALLPLFLIRIVVRFFKQRFDYFFVRYLLLLLITDKCTLSNVWGI